MPSPAPPPIDPAWLAFRQQGAAMVARERGLTPECRIKLARLARSLGIADDQVDAAIRSLAASEPAAPPNPQAERLRERLRKDLAGKRTIIGPTIEAQIVKAAVLKYSLDEATVRQVLGEVAAELKLKRITASEALRNLTGQIDHAVGSSTWLAREGWDRLRIAGGKWGIDIEVVDELIDERLAANKQDRWQRRFWLRAAATVTVIALTLAGVALLVLSIGPKRDDRSAAAPAGAATAGKDADASAAQPPAPPAWWDVDLAVDMASAKRRHGGMSGASDLMASDTPGDRATGYERLIEELRTSPAHADLLQTAGAILAGCHALEPDEAAAARLRTGLLSLLPSVDAPVPSRREQLDVPFWAADTAVSALHRRGIKAERRAALAGELGAALRTTFDLARPREEHGELARKQTALAAYQQLTAAAAKQPGTVAEMHTALWERVEYWLPEEELDRAEATLLAASLPAAGKHWSAYEQSVIRAIGGNDPLSLLKLVDALRRVEDPELSELLSHLLLLKTGARPASMKKSDVIRAVRKALGPASSGAMTAADRWLLLQEAAEEALAAADAPTSDTRGLLAQSVELAHLTTLAMALAQGEAGFATFDAGIDQPPQLEPAPATEEERAPDSVPRRFPSSDRESRQPLSRLIGMLSSQARNQQPLRLSALRGLARIAVSLPDLEPAQADPIATYLLARKNDEEFAAGLESLAALRPWKRLRLAVADSLPQSKLPPERQRQLVAALVADEVPDDTSIDGLRRTLLESVQRELRADSTTPPTGTGSEGTLADAAADALRQLYMQRARLLNVPASEMHRGTSPSGALELTLEPIATALKSRDGSYVAELPHRRRVARYIGGDDLRQTVALQRLAVELSARRAMQLRPQHAAAARQIETEALAASAAADNVLLQLRAHEASLLKLWMLYAVES